MGGSGRALSDSLACGRTRRGFAGRNFPLEDYCRDRAQQSRNTSQVTTVRNILGRVRFGQSFVAVWCEWPLDSCDRSEKHGIKRVSTSTLLRLSGNSRRITLPFKIRLQISHSADNRNFPSMGRQLTVYFPSPAAPVPGRQAKVTSSNRVGRDGSVAGK